MSSPFVTQPVCPKRGPGCPPVMALEEAVALGSWDAPLAAHVKSCGACGSYSDALVAEQDAFRLRARPDAFVESVQARRRPRFAGWGAGWMGALVALAAAGVLVVLRPGAEDIRAKGSAFSVVYLRAGMPEPRVVSPSMPLRAGDSLRLFYRASEPGHVAVLDRDGTGAASALFPFEGTRAEALEAQRQDPLPGDVVLDDAVGPEWLVSVFCRRPFDLQPLLRQLRSTPVKDPPKVSAPDCQVELLRIEKGRP